VDFRLLLSIAYPANGTGEHYECLPGLRLSFAFSCAVSFSLPDSFLGLFRSGLIKTKIEISVKNRYRSGEVCVMEHPNEVDHIALGIAYEAMENGIVISKIVMLSAVKRASGSFPAAPGTMVPGNDIG
jgi:hypothetical protein